jgi:HAD superfamily hydrolase (TIGR01509 family)
MLRAVLFDLFETLITESATRPAGVSSLAPLLGCDRDAFRREWKIVRPDVVVGRLTFREALRNIAAKLGRPPDEDTLERICDERRRIKARPFDAIEPDLLHAIADLRRRNLRLATISNCFAEDVTAWPHCALAPHFDAAVFSFQVGLAKPQPEMYLEATRRMGVQPFEALFVGDGMNDELPGAERAGLRAVCARWFVRRWPHFQDEPAAQGSSIETPDELLDMVTRHVTAGET